MEWFLGCIVLSLKAMIGFVIVLGAVVIIGMLIGTIVGPPRMW